MKKKPANSERSTSNLERRTPKPPGRLSKLKVQRSQLRVQALSTAALEQELLRRAIVKTTASIMAVETTLGQLHVKLDKQQAELTRQTTPKR